MELTLQPLRNMIKKAGGKRVSDSAAEELGNLMEKKAGEIAKEAQRLSEHAGRKTVMRQDVKLAKKNLER